MEKMITQMSKLLSERQKQAFDKIYEPIVVMRTPVNAVNKLVVMRSGEIRLYCSTSENHEYPNDVAPAYYSSVDCGMTWVKKYVENPQNKLLQCIYLAGVDKYFYFHSFTPQLNSRERSYPDLPDWITSGTHVAISEDGPDSENYEWYKVSDEGGCHIFRSMAYNEKTGSIFAVSEAVDEKGTYIKYMEKQAL